MPGLWVLILADVGGRYSCAALVTVRISCLQAGRRRDKSFWKSSQKCFSALGKRLQGSVYKAEVPVNTCCL